MGHIYGILYIFFLNIHIVAPEAPFFSFLGPKLFFKRDCKMFGKSVIGGITLKIDLNEF